MCKGELKFDIKRECTCGKILCETRKLILMEGKVLHIANLIIVKYILILIHSKLFLFLSFTKPMHFLQPHTFVSSIVNLYEMLKEFSWSWLLISLISAQEEAKRRVDEEAEWNHPRLEQDWYQAKAFLPHHHLPGALPRTRASASTSWTRRRLPRCTRTWSRSCVNTELWILWMAYVLTFIILS